MTLEVFFEIHKYSDVFPFVNMNPNVYRFYLGFLLFYILFIAHTSSGSLQWRWTQDPSEPELCRTSCLTGNTTTFCSEHGVNETARGRCCMVNGTVIGLDLSDCTLTTMPSLESVKSLRWLYLQDNPGLECDDKTFLNSFKGLKNLSEVVLPKRCNCTGGNDLWKSYSVNGSDRWCEGQRTNACKILNVTCPDNADCFANGPGFAECSCQSGWFEYKCLRKHGFPWTVVFVSIGASTVFVIVVLLIHQRKRRWGHCPEAEPLTKMRKENVTQYTQW